MYTVDRRLELDYSAERCWDDLTTWENWDAWSESDWFVLRSAFQFRRDPATAPGPGLRVIVTQNGKFSYSLRAAEWQKPLRLKLAIDDPGQMKGLQMEMTWSFTKETSVSTIIDAHIVFDLALPRYYGWLKHVLPLGWIFRKKTDQFIERAKRLAREK